MGDEQERHTLGEGTVLRHRDGDVVVIRFRKATDDGWWLYGSGGLSDRALTSGDWFYEAASVRALADAKENTALAFIEARNPGIDVEQVKAQRQAQAALGPGTAARSGRAS